MNKKILITIMVVFFVIILVLIITLEERGYFIRTPENFIKYENKNLGVILYYPKEWLKTEKTEEGMVILEPLGKEVINNCPLALNIIVRDRPVSLVVNEQERFIMQFPGFGGSHQVTPSDVISHLINFSRKHASAFKDLFVVENEQCRLKCMDINALGELFKKPKKDYYITYCGEENNYNQFSKTVEQVINSFLIF